MFTGTCGVCQQATGFEERGRKAVRPEGMRKLATGKGNVGGEGAWVDARDQWF